MANEIDLVVGEVAFQKITELIGRLKDVDTEFGKIATKFSDLGKTSNPQSTAELAKLTAENQKLNKALEELKSSYTNIDTELAKNTKLITDNTKATLADTIAKREKNSQATLEIKAGKELAQTYSQLDAQHKLAIKTAQDLAVSTGRTGKAYEEAKNKANELGNRLRVIDTDIGKHTRNVGNYSSSWNGLGNSINQLTREAPAFANSLQTGFMALSNNIPILTDELGVLIQKNKDLQAEGKPTQSILKTVAGAFFSWQTAISLGVTILTVYGAKIWELITAGTAAEKSQKALADTMVQASKDASKEIGQLDLLYRTANNVSLSIEQRRKAVDKMQEVYPSYFKNIKDENILNGESKNTYLELRDAIMASARAKAISAKLEESATGRLEKENAINIELEKSRKELIKVQQSTRDNYDIMIGGGTAGMGTEIRVTKKQQLANIYQDIKKHNQDLADLAAEALKEDSFFLKEQEKLEQKSAKLTYDRTKLKEEKVTKPKKDKSAEEAAKKEEERLKKEYETLKSNLERQKEIDKDILESFDGTVEEKTKLSIRLAQDEIDIANVVFQEKKRLAKGDVQLIQQANNQKLTDEENAQQENLKRVNKYYDEQEKAAAEYAKKLSKFNFLDTEEYKKYLADKKKADEDRKKYLEKTLDELKNYAESFSSEFASKLGFKETFDFFIKTDKEGKTMWQKLDLDGVSAQEKFKARFNAIAEASQEMFNKMAEYSMAHYEQDYARLEAQKEASLKFAGESTVAKERIEEQYAEKKKEIDKKKFESDKKISMVNIAIDTAQAIMTTLGETGFFGTPLAIIMGAFGAAQLAMVAAQQFPAYAEGTDNHSGGLMLVNDGQGSNFQEKVILPSGKVIRPQGRNVLMDAPKGTKVLNHEQQLFEMLQSNNISMSNPQSGGMTPEEMDEILGKHFGNIKTQNTIFDKNGFQSYVKNGNSITRSNSNRSQAIGISV